MFLVDAHLDLAYNALDLDRDLRLTLDALRADEVPAAYGTATVTLPELVRGRIGLVFGTLFTAPYSEERASRRVVYRDAEEAHVWALRQLEYYSDLARADPPEEPPARVVGDLDSLRALRADHRSGAGAPLGIVPLMEGADSIRVPEEAEFWFRQGLRLVGLAWGDTRYSGGAWTGGRGLSREGRRLLATMAETGLILDLSHMSEKASLEALDCFPGATAATHSNARALVPDHGERHLTDEQIMLIAERGGVIGVVLANTFLRAGHRREDPKANVTLNDVVLQVDHMCQLLGSAAAVGIGSDFDGGFGREHIPSELDSVADLHHIGEALHDRGYSSAAIAGVLGENWLRFLEESWK